MKGRPIAPEVLARRESRAGENNTFYGKKHTEKTKALLRAAKLGKPGPNRGRKYEKQTCDRCGFVGGGGSMKRYHFENCKNVQPITNP